MGLPTVKRLALVDEDEVVNHANQEGSGDRSLFSSALGYINQNKVGCAHIFVDVV